MAKWGDHPVVPVPGTEYYSEFESDEVVTVRKSELISLRDDSAFLKALYAAGVDNWEGYNEACEAHVDVEEL